MGKHFGKAQKGFLLTAGFLLLTLPLVLVVVQQQQELRQNAAVIATDPTVIPSVEVTPTAPYVSPTFFCLAAPCTTTPTAEPTVTTAPHITASPEPTTEVTLSPAPTEDPCTTTSIAHSKKKSKHTNDQGGLSKFMEQILQFFIELINLLLKLIGGNPTPTPTPTPTPGIDPTGSVEPTTGPTEGPEPTTDPCAEPTTNPSTEPTNEPEPTEPVSVTVSPTAFVTPSASVSPTSIVIAPTTSGVPSATVVPSGATPSNVSPTENPCDSTASIATSDKKSKHKNHGNGLIREFMKFLIELFTLILKIIGQTPGTPTPTPSPIPTLAEPSITNDPGVSLAPTITVTPAISIDPTEPAATEAITPSAEPTPCIVSPTPSVAPTTSPSINATPTLFFNLQRGR